MAGQKKNGGRVTAPDTPVAMGENTPKMRADKWLWHARFVKTRGLATKLITGGHLTVNGEKTAKASFQIKPTDVLIFPQAKHTRTVKILALSSRRGPAPEAQALYEDLDPPKPRENVTPQSLSAPKFDGKGRPTKKDRRNLLKTLPPLLD